MSAAALLARTRAQGFTLTALDGRLMVEPASRVPEVLRAELRGARAELLRLLAANDDHIAEERQDCQDSQGRRVWPAGDVDATGGDFEALTDDEREAWIERAGIGEFDGNMTRAAAEALAWEAWRIGRLP